MKSFIYTLTLSTLVATSVAQAAGPAPITANLTVTTLYKYRGLDQSNPRNLAPAIQGGFDFTKQGFYVGNWNSSVGTGVGSEVDLYGGYKGNISKDLGFDVGMLQYIYAGDTQANTLETYAALSYDIFSFKYSVTLSKDYFGQGNLAAKKGRFTSYFDFSANYEVIKNLTLNGHFGFTLLSSGLRSDAVKLKNYIDYKLGATYDLGSGFSVAGAVAGANQKKTLGDKTKPRAILSITKTL
jgi:uncharacterized protein (TIGR02001 family)